jgi:hypothetical protein
VVVGAVGVWAVPAVAAPPANTSAPTIAGTARVGQELTAQNGTWSNSPTAFRYQWQRCQPGGPCSTIAGAVEKTFLVTNLDQDRTLRVIVTASNLEGIGSARSAPTQVVEQSTAAQNTARPTISGEAKVGEQLTASEGTWTNSPTSYQYRWQRCDVNGRECEAIQLGQAKNYQVRAADIGSRLRVRVLAINAQGIGAATSDPTGVVVPSTPIEHRRPALTLLSAKILGHRMYARFRVCDDRATNLTVIATDSKPRVRSQVRRFSTIVPPNPCGVYTRSWNLAKKFRTKGRYTVSIQVRDTTEMVSPLRKKSFTLR